MIFTLAVYNMLFKNKSKTIRPFNPYHSFKIIIEGSNILYSSNNLFNGCNERVKFEIVAYMPE